MKCPSCQFVSSDLRDICPKCLHDLRAEKKAIGIAITNPDASYNELVQKLIGNSAKDNQAPKNQEQPKNEGFFARLFKRSPEKRDSDKVNYDKSSSQFDSASNSKEESGYNNEQNVNSEEQQYSGDYKINSPSIEDKLIDILEAEYPTVEIEPDKEIGSTSIVEDINLHSDIEYEDSIEIEPAEEVSYHAETAIVELPETSSSIDDLVSQALNQVDQQDYDADLATYTSLSTTSEYVDTSGGISNKNGGYTEHGNLLIQAETEELPSSESSLQDVVDELVDEELNNEDFEEFEDSYFEEVTELNAVQNSESDNYSDDVEPVFDQLDNLPHIRNGEHETEQYFDMAANDIANLRPGIDYDISLPPTTVTNKDEVEVLFSLTKQGLESPNSIEKLENQIDLSSSRTLRSETLEETLKSTEKAIETPKLSLKELQNEEALRIRGTLAKDDHSDNRIYRRQSKHKGPAPATLWKRFASSVIDGCTISFITFAIVVILCLTITPELTDKLWSINSYEFYEVLPIYGLLLVTFIITYFSYPILSLSFTNNTLGMYLMGIRLRTNDLKKIRLSHIFVRCFSRPVSLVFFGYLPPLFGKKSLPDYLAQTTVIS